MDAAVVPIPTEIANQISPDMMGALIPTQLLLNSDGTLQKVEVNGEIPGKSGTVKIQVGYEDKGRATGADFPPTPQPAEVTALPDKAAADDFWARFGQVHF